MIDKQTRFDQNDRKSRMAHLKANRSNFILPELDETKKTILIADDVNFIVKIVASDVDKMLKANGIDPNEYNIVCLTGEYAAHHAISMIVEYDVCFDYMILDIIFGGYAPAVNNEERIIEYDGIDIIAHHKEKFSDYPVNVMFYTSCYTGKGSLFEQKLTSKFYDIFSDDIESYILSKETFLDNSQRQELIFKKLFKQHETEINN